MSGDEEEDDINAQLYKRRRVDNEDVDTIPLDDDLVRTAWDDSPTLSYSSLSNILIQTVLTLETSAVFTVKYMLTLEYMFGNRENVQLLCTHIYTPVHADHIIAKIGTNLCFIDMCTPDYFVDTLLAGVSEPDLIQRVERTLNLVTKVGNIARLLLTYHSDMPFEPIMPPTSAELTKDRTPHQKLFEFLLQTAGNEQLRRTDTAMFRPLRLPDGTATCFYEYDCDIGTFMYRSVAPARLHPVEYDAMTNRPSTPGQTINLLSHVPDVRCPFMVKNRHLFSFSNGIYDVRTNTISPYNRLPVEFRTASTSKYLDYTIDQDMLLCDPRDIETPVFNKILTDQQLDDKAIYWMYALCGRLLHDVGTLDDWQVCMYIRGVAGSGKSTILKTVSMFYEAGDIGYLMSDGQSTFSDEHLYNKFITMAMDIDKKTQFSVTRFNSLVSGENISVNRKFKTALNVKWTAPVVMASNAQPPWEDVGGNLIRRFVIFLFDHPVRESDPRLFDKLKQELPVLLVKMARTYLHAVQHYGGRSLWDDGILPAMCYSARRQYLISTNPISAFLESDQVEFQKFAETPAADIRRSLIQYMRESGGGVRKGASITMISKVDHGHLFAMYGCTIVERNNGGTRSVVIVGLRLSDPSPL